MPLCYVDSMELAKNETEQPEITTNCTIQWDFSKNSVRMPHKHTSKTNQPTTRPISIYPKYSYLIYAANVNLKKWSDVIAFLNNLTNTKVCLSVPTKQLSSTNIDFITRLCTHYDTVSTSVHERLDTLFVKCFSVVVFS